MLVLTRFLAFLNAGEPTENDLLRWALALAVLVAPLGALLGVVLLVRGDRRGNHVIGVAIVVAAIIFAVWEWSTTS